MDLIKMYKVEPQIELDGRFCFCPICGYSRLLTSQSNCPDCNVELDWDWIEKMKIKK